MARIRITENELKQLIRESVENVLNEIKNGGQEQLPTPPKKLFNPRYSRLGGLLPLLRKIKQKKAAPSPVAKKMPPVQPTFNGSKEQYYDELEKAGQGHWEPLNGNPKGQFRFNNPPIPNNF